MRFHKNANYPALLAFSLGKLDNLATLDARGLDCEEDLFLLMASACLPMSRLPQAETARMTAALPNCRHNNRAIFAAGHRIATIGARIIIITDKDSL